MSIFNPNRRVLIADSTTCRFYDLQMKPMKLQLVREFNEPENRLKDSEITEDKQGRYQATEGQGTAHGAFQPRSDPKDVKIDDFAREIAKELDEQRKKNAFESLIFITSAKMTGLILKHCTDEVKKLPSLNFEKNMPWLSDNQLCDFLKDHKLEINALDPGKNS